VNEEEEIEKTKKKEESKQNVQNVKIYKMRIKKAKITPTGELLLPNNKLYNFHILTSKARPPII
jgi:CO dehydrogenase/acetyl-CoA synthase beta subunit